MEATQMSLSAEDPYITAQRKYELAIADLNRAIEINPSDASAYLDRGGAYDGLRHYDLAVSDYNKALEDQALETRQFFIIGG